MLQGLIGDAHIAVVCRVGSGCYTLQQPPIGLYCLCDGMRRSDYEGRMSKGRNVGGLPFLGAYSYLTVWGVDPVVTHQTSWLDSIGVCGVRQNQAGGSAGTSAFQLATLLAQSCTPVRAYSNSSPSVRNVINVPRGTINHGIHCSVR